MLYKVAIVADESSGVTVYSAFVRKWYWVWHKVGTGYFTRFAAELAALDFIATRKTFWDKWI